MEMKKVLIADDNKYMLDALQEIIQIGGYRAEVADVDRPFKLSNELPDLILMDIKMSGKDGRVICRELKSKSKTKNIPIILLSASHQLHDSALEAGADIFLAKPFSMNDLLEKINKLMNNKRSLKSK